MVSKIVIPDLGATDADIALDKWLVKPGNYVKAGMPIFVVTTDKATMEVESFRDGYIRDILVPAGNSAVVGEVIAIIADSMEESIGDIVNQGTDRVLASPLARRIAQKQGIDLSMVKGSGLGGRIQKRDVQAFLQENLSKEPSVSAEALATPASEPFKRVPISAMRKAIAKRTLRSKTEAPHFYVSIEIDMTEAQAFRQQTIALAEKSGWAPPSLNDMAIKASALALKKAPELNASLQGEEIVYYGDIHIGLVVGLSEGMIVPVIRHADRKNLYTLAAATRSLRDRATAHKLLNSELTGSTFTISNLGMFGVDGFIAVINPPEAAILALGASKLKPAVWEGQVVSRELMIATLSVDHRIVDGETAAKFLSELKYLLENPILLTLEPPEEKIL